MSEEAPAAEVPEEAAAGLALARHFGPARVLADLQALRATMLGRTPAAAA